MFMGVVSCTGPPNQNWGHMKMPGHTAVRVSSVTTVSTRKK